MITFPLWPIAADGTCGCKQPKCLKQPRNAGKHPVPSGWQQLSTPAPIPPGYGVGLACGAASGVFVVDCDIKEGVDGYDVLRAMGTLPDTLMARTGSGGLHLYFAHPGYDVPNTVRRIGKNIDTRGEGGYVVIPPSPHLSGKRYEWINEGMAPAHAPPWLLESLSRNRAVGPGAGRSARQRLEKVRDKWRKNGRSTAGALQCVLDGVTFAESGTRDDVAWALAGALSREAVMIGVDVTELAGEFALSLGHMGDDAPNIADKLVRAFADASDRRVVLISDDIDRVVRETIGHLGRCENLYQRGDGPGGLVRLLPSGRIEPIPSAALMRDVSASVRYLRGDSAVEVPERVLAAILASSEWPGLRPLVGVTETPVLRPDGGLHTEPGYDVATGWYLNAEGPWPAGGSLDELYDVLDEFPWVDAAALVAFLAAVLTPMARPVFTGTAPLFLFEAADAGTGKGLLVKVAGLIALGRMVPSQSLSGSEEERRKLITTHMVAGSALVCLDNVGRDKTLGGDALCSVVTEPVWSDRILGASRQWVGPNMLTLYATANNATLGADMGRRVIPIRIVADDEQPAMRTGWKHADLLAVVRERRNALAMAALGVLRRYLAAGKPRVQHESLGSFEGWSATVLAALRYEGLPGIEAARELAQAGDEERGALVSIFTEWAEAFGDRWVKTAEIMARTLDQPMGGMALGISMVIGNNPTAVGVGRFLGSIKDRRVVGRTLRKRTLHGVNEYRLA